jgi:hypothetical protein
MSIAIDQRERTTAIWQVRNAAAKSGSPAIAEAVRLLDLEIGWCATDDVVDSLISEAWGLLNEERRPPSRLLMSAGERARFFSALNAWPPPVAKAAPIAPPAETPAEHRVWPATGRAPTREDERLRQQTKSRLAGEASRLGQLERAREARNREARNR